MMMMMMMMMTTCFEQCCISVCRGMASPEFMEVSSGQFHVIIDNHETRWNLPVYYDDLNLIGAGRFGQVW